MNTFLIVALIYFGVGVLMNFVGPVSRMIWAEKMKLALQAGTPAWKRIGFIAVLRVGVIALYPIFIFK
jgi:hypothetical protein